MKKGVCLVLTVILCALLLKSCIRRDNFSEIQTGNSSEITEVLNTEFPQNSKTVTINGVEYLQSQAPIGKFGGDLVTSTIGEGPKTFNPFNAKDNTSATMAEIMYDGLVTTHPKTGEVIPKLAKAFKISGNNYIIELRKGIKWSDGKEITADDVIFTWRDIIFAGYGNTSTRDSMVIAGQLPTVEKLGEYEVKFTTPQPFAPFLRLLATPIAPKHIFEPAVKKGKEYFDTFLSTNTNPESFVISGAFKLQEYIPAQRVVFVRNPNYYEINLEGKKLPYLDRLVYLIVGDINNEVLKFEGGELDVIGLHGANVARFKERESYSDYKIYNIGPDTGTMYLSMNLNTRKDSKGKFYVDPIKQKWFGDLNFRRAVDYAIDRKNMVLNVANGLGLPLFTPETLNSIFLNKDLKPYDRNTNKSRELLKQSGFYWDSNNKLYDKFGNRVEFNLYTNAGNTEREAIGVMVKQDLEDLGMKVNFKPIEFNSLVNKLVSTPDWDMVIMGFTGSPLEPNGGKNVWLSNGTLHLFNQRQPDEYNSPKLPFEQRLDYLMEQGALVINFDERKKYYDEYQKIVYDEKPFIYLYSPIRISAIRKKFGNIYPSELSGITYNLEEIYIKDKNR